MTDLEKRLDWILHSSVGSAKERLAMMIRELQLYNGSIVLNENKKLEFVDSSTLEDYLYTRSRSVVWVFDHQPRSLQSDPIIQAIAQRDADLKAIAYILRALNEGIHGDDMIILYENHFLKSTYKKIHGKYGFSKSKCTSANARIYAFLEKSFFSPTRALDRAEK